MTFKEIKEKILRGDLLSTEEIDRARELYKELLEMKTFLDDQLPAQIYGRRCRLENGKIIYDDNGDRITIRGIFGEIWTRPLTPDSIAMTKFIGPFGERRSE